MKKIAIVVLILLCPVFWPIMLFTLFLKTLDRVKLTTAVTIVIGAVMAILAVGQLAWITLLTGGF